MKAHWQYLKYVMRHKWFVFLAGCKVGVPLWRLIIHDWSKFLPCEWSPYVHCFYAPDGSKQYKESAAFARAWRHHQRVNNHHWQYWLLTWDRGAETVLEMTEIAAREMVADWMGAGRAITGKWEASEWYYKNRETIRLNIRTRKLVEELLAQSAPPICQTPRPT